jgi:hypothetical protein
MNINLVSIRRERKYVRKDETEYKKEGCYLIKKKNYTRSDIRKEGKSRQL